MDVALHVLVSLPGMVISLCAFFAAWATVRRVKALTVELNSRMDALLVAARTGGLAEGRAEGLVTGRSDGLAEGRAEGQAVAVARTAGMAEEARRRESPP